MALEILCQLDFWASRARTVDVLRARIDAALEERQQAPTGSGERNADRPETHGINARPPARAGSNTATANGDVRLAEPVPSAETTWRKSAPRRAPRIPCECCASPQAFKRMHGLTPWQASQPPAAEAQQPAAEPAEAAAAAAAAAPLSFLDAYFAQRESISLAGAT
jgi:hypothetical protein